jgi:hypothetical protein
MCGNILTQRFLAFPDHGHLRSSPSHNNGIVSRGPLRSDDGLPMPNASPHGVPFQPCCPVQRRRCMARDYASVLEQRLCRRQHILPNS